MTPYWFERHPGATLFGVALIGCVALVAAAEWWAGSQRPAWSTPPPPGRQLELREYPPTWTHVFEPTPEALAGTDGLPDRSVAIALDADGYIEPSRVHAAPDRTVLFLGGSTTACAWLPDSLRFHALVARRLGADLGLRVNALNTARSGNHALHSLDLFEAKGLAERPDVAVLMHAVNDLSMFVRHGDYWAPNTSRSLIVPAPCDTPRCDLRRGVVGLRDLLVPDLWWTVSRGRRAAAREFHAPGSPPDSAEAVRMFRRALETFVRTARTWDVTPVLMTQANRITEGRRRLPFDEAETGISFAAYRSLYIALNETTRAVARDLSVPLVDLDRAVPREPAYVYDFVHLNDAGSRLAAERIAEVLAALPALRGEPEPPG